MNEDDNKQSSITSLLMFGVLTATMIYISIFCAIALSQIEIEKFPESFFRSIAMFGVPFLFLLMLVIAMTIKLIMSPITKALKQAEEISFIKPDIRLNAGIFPHEIRPLARAVNDALGRLEAGIIAQKDFIANAAHELRTPLSILRSHVDLLQDKDTAAKMRADVDTMTRLVAQLLDTARLESPETMDMHDVDLAETVRSVSQAIWPLMVKDGRNFEVIGIEHPVIIRGNFDSICRAIRNLLENALKYTPKASPITVSLNGTTIKISDKGAGIAAEDKEKIFGKFSRPDRQRGSGAGLGLFIVRRIMQIHGGHVSVENLPEGGAVFILSFPSSGNPQDSAS